MTFPHCNSGLACVSHIPTHVCCLPSATSSDGLPRACARPRFCSQDSCVPARYIPSCLRVHACVEKYSSTLMGCPCSRFDTNTTTSLRRSIRHSSHTRNRSSALWSEQYGSNTVDPKFPSEEHMTPPYGWSLRALSSGPAN